MTANNAGAASYEKVDWDAIHWQTANQEVSRLQARIVKATQESRWGKSESPATSANPLVQCQSTGGQTSDRKFWETDSGGRRRNLEHSKEESISSIIATAKGISTPTTSQNLHSQEERENAPSRYTDHERPGHASAI